MDAILEWFSRYWWVVALCLALAMKVLNSVTTHWGDASNGKVKKVCLFLVDILDIFKTTKPPLKK